MIFLMIPEIQEPAYLIGTLSWYMHTDGFQISSDAVRFTAFDGHDIPHCNDEPRHTIERNHNKGQEENVEPLDLTDIQPSTFAHPYRYAKNDIEKRVPKLVSDGESQIP